MDAAFLMCNIYLDHGADKLRTLPKIWIFLPLWWCYSFAFKCILRESVHAMATRHYLLAAVGCLCAMVSTACHEKGIILPGKSSRFSGGSTSFSELARGLRQGQTICHWTKNGDPLPGAGSGFQICQKEAGRRQSLPKSLLSHRHCKQVTLTIISLSRVVFCLRTPCLEEDILLRICSQIGGGLEPPRSDDRTMDVQSFGLRWM